MCIRDRLESTHEVSYQEAPQWFKNWEDIGLIAWRDKNNDGLIQYASGNAFDPVKPKYLDSKGEFGERVIANNSQASSGNEVYIDRDIMVLANPEIADLPPWIIALVAAGALAAALYQPRPHSYEYSNVHRGLHYLSNVTTEKYEGVRETVRRFLGASKQEEILLNSGTTEGINTVSYGWAAPRLKAGDEIILSVMEHHANIVPWHFLRERQGVVLKWIEPEPNGQFDHTKLLNKITSRTKLIAITQMSNVLGSVVDVKAICDSVKKSGIAVLVDGSQSAVHMPVNVQDIGCDFSSFDLLFEEKFFSLFHQLAFY